MWIFTLTALLAFSITPAILKWYRKNDWLDKPDKNKHVKVLHCAAVPRGGGLIVFLAIACVALLTLQVDKQLLGILLGATILAVTGVLDDIYDIHPLVRVVTGTVAALCVVGSGIGIAYVTNPLGPGVIHLNQPQLAFSLFGQTHTIWILADFFALLFIVWNMNIVNWSKGVDGQLPGFVSIGALFIGLLSTRFLDDPTQFNTMHLSFIVAGAFAGYLYWNWYPQKSMPGYGGGSLGGYFLAVLAILSGAKVATTLMVLAVPTADAIFTISRRIKAGKLPWWGDRGHLHHKFLDVLGWGRRRIAVFYWLSSLVLGLLSLYLDTWGKLLTIAATMAIIFGFLVWAKYTQTSIRSRRNKA